MNHALDGLISAPINKAPLLNLLNVILMHILAYVNTCRQSLLFHGADPRDFFAFPKLRQRNNSADNPPQALTARSSAAVTVL